MLQHRLIQRGGAGHRQIQRGCRRCSTHAGQCSERQRQQGQGVLLQAEKVSDDAQKLAEENKDKQCFQCQKKVHIKVDYKKRQREKAKESGEVR